MGGSGMGSQEFWQEAESALFRELREAREAYNREKDKTAVRDRYVQALRRFVALVMDRRLPSDRV